MAERLSKVYGTEMDKVNCPFFYKIGACRYGDSCERIHNKPPISETVLLEHMYENSAIETAIISGNIVNEEDAEKALTKYLIRQLDSKPFLKRFSNR